ncbi:uncharacterized protein BDR25DRAFT_312500 [Lindgomyces ingoldianus]|uniref:Uncharacterized protein n=1 Tax=Lindgomyces ingoldianus TaxID=673940 RepID=A0ACB6R548_9PLEO|nr:uncharacterized protein BDR25DRAFT_312500 [Lindgomyces ingoldianus]KAF2473435.1 hypothetical protein BDR25DRAFT_312500 [Lindgomyces ingoldianus]
MFSEGSIPDIGRGSASSRVSTRRNIESTLAPSSFSSTTTPTQQIETFFPSIQSSPTQTTSSLKSADVSLISSSDISTTPIEFLTATSTPTPSTSANSPPGSILESQRPVAHSNLSPGIIAGIVIGTIVGVLLVAAVAVCFSLRYRRQNRYPQPHERKSEHGGYEALYSATVAQAKAVHVTNSKYEMSRDMAPQGLPIREWEVESPRVSMVKVGGERPRSSRYYAFENEDVRKNIERKSTLGIN